MTAQSNSIPKDEKTILGHPRGLVILFFTEMWERFSYYGMRGLLIIYLTQHFLFSDERSSILYGAYTALVYIMTIIGGSLADKYLGARKAVTFGAILLVLGHIGMAFEGSGSKQVVTIGSNQYEFKLDGRGGDARQLLVTPKGQTYVNFGKQSLEVASPAVLGLPKNIGGFDYSTKTEKNEETQKSTTTLTYKDKSFQLITEGKGEDEKSYLVSGDKKSQVTFSAKPAMTFGTNPSFYIDNPGKITPKGELIVAAKVSGFDYAIENSNSNGNSIDQVISLNGKNYNLKGSKDGDLTISSDSGSSSFRYIENPEIAISSAQELGVSNLIEGSSYSTKIVREELYVNILYLSLALIIAGVGYLKANISTIVGSLYQVGDERRDSGFTLFYMGINLGSFLSSLTCGIIGIVYGWAYGFGLAGIGMLLGLLTFLWKQDWLEGKAEPPVPSKLKEKAFGPINYEWMCYLIGLGIIAISMFFMKNPDVMGNITLPIGIAMLAFLLFYAFTKLQGEERNKMLAATYFVLAQIPFWALFEQAGSSLNLFTDRLVDRNFLGWSVPAPVFQSLNAFFIFTFAPLIAWLWIWLAKRNLNPSTPVKFAMGVAMAGLGFLVLVAGMKMTGSAGMTAVMFIFLIYFIHTMAELMVSPVGLSSVTKLAPAQAVGMTMGAWFLYSGLSNFLAGVISRNTGAETLGGQLTDVASAKATYADVYSQVGYIAIGIAVVMLLISPVIKKLMGNAK